MDSTSFLVKGGSIYTMDPRRPWAQCLVVHGNTIVYVGPETGSEQVTDNATEVIDVDGGLCLPGFIDAHDHYGNLAMTKIGVDVTGLTDPDAIVARIRQFALDHPEKPFIQGFGWTNATFDGGSPTRALLDQAINDRPCVILSWHGHDGWFNTAAMRGGEVDARLTRPGSGHPVLSSRSRGMAHGTRGGARGDDPDPRRDRCRELRRPS